MRPAVLLGVFSDLQYYT